MASRFPVIDVTQFPRITLVEIPDEGVIMRARMDKLKERWAEYDPPLAAQYDVENTEFDPIVINQELNTSFELNNLSRLNAFGEATTLAFAWGENLDAIASRYPGGVPRLPLVENPRPYSEAPGDWEEDDRYRRRIWLAPNAFNSAGAADAYVFWALTEDVTLRDATAEVERIDLRHDPEVHITLLAEGDDPMPSLDIIERVRARLSRTDIKPLTDIVKVHGPRITTVSLKAHFYAFPGPDAGILKTNILVSLAAMRTRQRWLGYDFTQNAYQAALYQPGVANAIPLAPIIDIRVGPQQVVDIRPVTVDSVTYMGRQE